MSARGWIQARVVGGLALAMVLTAAPLAIADPIELTVVVGPSINQIDNSPCIIGDPSCNNPGTFTYTLMGSRLDAGTLSSPVYTVDQIRSIVGGSAFFVGIDLNQAMGHNNGGYTVESFMVTIDGITAYSTGAATTLFPMNPGNGFSDASIARIDLTGYSGSQTVQFTTTFSGATAGREQYFLRAALDQGGAGAAPAPEPATMILLGSGFAGLAAYRRRRRTGPSSR